MAAEALAQAGGAKSEIMCLPSCCRGFRSAQSGLHNRCPARLPRTLQFAIVVASITKGGTCNDTLGDTRHRIFGFLRVSCDWSSAGADRRRLDYAVRRQG